MRAHAPIPSTGPGPRGAAPATVAHGDGDAVSAARAAPPRAGLLGSLSGRLLVLIGVIVLTAQFGSWVAWRFWQYEDFASRVADRVASQAELVRLLMAELPYDRRAGTAASLNGAPLQIFLGKDVDRLPPHDERLSDVRDAIAQRLPAGTVIHVNETSGRLAAWVRLQLAGEAVSIRVRLPPRELVLEMTAGERIAIVGLLILLAALPVLWLVSRPLGQLSREIEIAGPRLRPLAMPAGCPTELRRLVTAFNRLVATLRRRELERERLLAGVSHDLRSPLARLRLRLEASTDERQRDGMARDLAALDRITGQFLSFVRAGEAASTRRTPIVAVLEDLVARYRDAGRDVSLALHASVLASTPPLADPLAIERIASNLVDNALAHGAEPVRIALDCDGGRIRLSVRDAGPGLDPGQFGSAREPFVRLDPARKHAGGCGLGLAIVDRLADSLGGTVFAERENDGFEVGVHWPAT